MKHFFSIFAFMMIVATPVIAQSAKSTFSEITDKKLIEYGWDVPQTDFVSTHLEEMQRQPFDGLIFQLKDRGNIFLVKPPNQKVSADELRTLRGLKAKWTTFTDNFIAMYAQSDMNWASDDDWKQITSRVSDYSQAARISGCVGLLFDPEPYGFNPWNFDIQHNPQQLSFEDYSQIVYRRGQSFMRAMKKEFPNIKLLMFFQYSLFYDKAHQTDPDLRGESLRKMRNWNLLLPFLNGMLSASSNNVQLIDGNEPSYYYKTADDFYRAYWAMHQGAKINVPKKLRKKYTNHVFAANALYMDYVFDKQGIGYNVASGMTDEEKAKWFEHNAYYALKTTDEYVWLYSERMNWWTHENWPAGIKEAIISARQKLMNGEPLGYDLKSTFTNAQNRLSKLLHDRLIRRSAKIPRLKDETTMSIDGKLDEPFYQQENSLAPFVTLISPHKNQQAAVLTKAFVSYDDKNLYIAFRCTEPNIAQQKIFDAPRDGAIWNGENVDFSILKPGQKLGEAAAQYYHFILNPNNIQWDSVDAEKQSDTAFNANWRSATSQDKNGWTAEIALAWDSIGIHEVNSGMTFRANLARFRVNGNQTFLSSWSQFISGFQEPENFGTWILE